MSLAERVDQLEQKLAYLMRFVGVANCKIVPEDEDTGDEDPPKPARLFKVKCDAKVKSGIPSIWLFGTDEDAEWSWSNNIEGGRAFDYRSACILVDSETQQPKGYGRPYIVRFDGSPIEDEGE